VPPDSDDLQAAIIRRVYRPGSTYSHAESVLARLRHYERSMPPEQAIEAVYADVIGTTLDSVTPS
jgi:hypothetical protein